MTISRIFCFAGTLALATLIGTSASSYAAQPCCKWVGDKYINLKTGKQVKPPKGSVAPSDARVVEAKSKPAAPPDPYHRLADRYYGYPVLWLLRPITRLLRLPRPAASYSGLWLREAVTLAIN